MTIGYVGFFKRAIEAVKKFISGGRSHTHDADDERRRLIEDVHVWTRLIAINGNDRIKLIEGTIDVKIDKERRMGVTLIEHMRTNVSRFFSDIVITVKRVKDGRRRG